MQFPVVIYTGVVNQQPVRILFRILSIISSCLALVTAFLHFPGPTLSGLPAEHVILLCGIFLLFTAVQHIGRNQGNIRLLFIRLVFALLTETYYILPAVPGALLLFSFVIDAGMEVPWPRNGILIAAGLVLAVSFRFYYWPMGSGGTWRELVSAYMLTFFLFIAAVMVVITHEMLAKKNEADRENSELRDSLNKLTEVNSGFLRYADEAENRGERDERQRLTRELHDIVGRSFTNIIMMIRAHNCSDDKDQHSDRLIQWINSTSKRGLEEVRRILYYIREQDPAEPDFQQMVLHLCDAYTRGSGVLIEVNWGNLPRMIPAGTGSHLFGVIQEAMTNAFRHGRATKLNITFWVADKRLRVIIEDNGQGSAESEPGIGLKGMQERINVLSGHLTCGNGPEGYRVVAEVPVNNE